MMKSKCGYYYRIFLVCTKILCDWMAFMEIISRFTSDLLGQYISVREFGD